MSTNHDPTGRRAGTTKSPEGHDIEPSRRSRNRDRSLSHRTRTARLLAGCLALLLLSTLPTTAQWEGVYGGAGCEDGGEAVTTAYLESSCGAQAGYLTVGWTWSTPTSSCASDKDIFLTRTDGGGLLQWQRSIDIGGDDHAYDVKQTSDSGFIIVGITENTPPAEQQNCLGSTTATDDIFLLKIDGCGNVQWLTIYGTDAAEEYGYEVIETTVGTAGEFVVAGYQLSANGKDGLLFRTSSTGTLLWDQTYGSTTGAEELHSLTESTASVGGANPTGDIIATGRIQDNLTGRWDVYLVRVNSANGNIGAAPQGAMYYGGAEPDMGLSVIELQQAPNAGDIVVAGWSRTRPPAFGFTSMEILVMKTGPNICLGPTADMLYGDQGAGADLAQSIKEITGTGTAGNLIVTGYTNGFGHGGYDAFLMEIVPAAVAVPVTPALGIWGAGLGFDLYGGTGNDYGRSVIDDGTNYVLAGSERSNRAGSSPADPEQMYLVQTIAAGVSGCDTSETPLTIVPGYTWGCNAATLGPILDTCSPEYDVDTLDYDTVVCSTAPRRTVPVRAVEAASGLIASVAPNPISRGMPMVALLDQNRDGSAQIEVHDVRGELVYNRNIGPNASAEVVIPTTEEWGLGTYVLTVRSGEKTDRKKFILQE